jgi:hypothetical protein
MATAPDRAPLPRRRLLPLTVFIAAAVALLAFVGSAFAETKIGEGTSPAQPGLPGEVDLLKGSTSYDLATGAVTVSLTTRVAPESAGETEAEYVGGLFDASFPCSTEGFEAAEEEAEEEGENFGRPYPFYEAFTFNAPLTSEPGGPPVPQAYAEFEATEPTEGGVPEVPTPASKAISGTTVTIGATIPAAANQPFNCVEVAAVNFESFEDSDFMAFPLTTKPEPPPAAPTDTQSTPASSTSTSTSNPTPAPVLPPPAISIAKAKKPLKLKVGKWATVKVKVTNTGGTATAPGTLQLKTTKGVNVKAARQKLPALLPGGLWTVSYKVKLTAKAKKSSTLSLVGAADGLSAKGSLVLKSLG